jgi:hypothetical protein
MEKSFTTAFLVDNTPKEAFDAINNVRGWWSGEIDGNTQKLDDEFSYRYKDIHYSKQKLVEMVPNKKVVWLITDSQLNFTEDKTEWTGTKISFDISEKDNKTQVQFTHNGLVPHFECYNGCSNAWTDYINNSLRNLITTGKGYPAEGK